MLLANVEIGQTLEMPELNTNCPLYLGKISYFDFLSRANLVVTSNILEKLYSLYTFECTQYEFRF